MSRSCPRGDHLSLILLSSVALPSLASNSLEFYLSLQISSSSFYRPRGSHKGTFGGGGVLGRKTPLGSYEATWPLLAQVFF